MKYRTKTRVVEAITFDELVEYGRRMTPPNHLMNGMPWSFKYKGCNVTHENDSCYSILGPTINMPITPGDMLITGEHGEIWTCMHDTFEAGYEPAEASLQSEGVALIAAERKRQIEVEGWSAERDDGYTECELVDAAVCYAAGTRSWVWPWAKEWWKPSPDNHVRDLVKAGALIAAEIDRLQRKAACKDAP